jgi:Mg/Co/Ni transporter MgtE
MEATVADIMRTRFTSFKKTDSIVNAIGVFVRDPDAVFPVVDDKGRIIGEISQHEALKLALEKRQVSGERILGPLGIRNVMERTGTTVGDFMKTNEVKVRMTKKVSDAAQIMLDTNVLTLEVVDDKMRPVGFISELDILKFMKKKLQGKAK